MTKFYTFLVLLLTVNAIAQSDDEYWDKWNKNYPQVDITEILKQEKQYAVGVEKDPNIPPYYSRLDKYKFQAKYLGKIRVLDKSVLTSMKNVFKLHVGNTSQLDNMCDSEVLFKVGKEELWMPIQPRILEALKSESKKGDVLNLYCLYFNEHNSENKLFNIFLVSEFNK